MCVHSRKWREKYQKPPGDRSCGILPDKDWNPEADSDLSISAPGARCGDSFAGLDIGKVVKCPSATAELQQLAEKYLCAAP